MSNPTDTAESAEPPASAARGAEIVAPLRRPFWVLRALGANFVLAPAVALATVALLPLDPGYALGLLVLGFAAGSPLLPKLAEAGVDHKLWMEQPENFATCLATRPYRKDEVAQWFKKCNLAKGNVVSGN